MKVLLCYLLTFICYACVLGQKYYVIHIKGNIVKVSNQQKLKTGIQISAEEQLNFLEKEAVAVVISREKGRMILTAEKTEKNDQGQFLAYVQQVLFPMKYNRRLSTREVNQAETDDIKEPTKEDSYNVSDFKKFFGTQNYVILGNQLFINIDEKKYPAKNKIFVYSYIYKKRKIQKILTMRNDTLIIDKEKLYSSKGKYIDPTQVESVSLYYLDKKKKKNIQKLALLKPIFIPEEKILKELLALSNFLYDNQVMKGSELLKELYNFTEEVYGHSNFYVFSDWVATKGLVKE